jgi:hypothetical protein
LKKIKLKAISLLNAYDLKFLYALGIGQAGNIRYRAELAAKKK